MDTLEIFSLIETDIAAAIIASERLRAEIDALLESRDRAQRLAKYRVERVSERTHH